MNTDAFFSDTTENYCTPAEPDPGQPVRICFRVAREDRVRVDLIRVLQNEEEAVPMYEMGRDRYFRYFEIQLETGTAPLEWYFQIVGDDELFLYDSIGLVISRRPDRPFRIIPGFHTPDWAKGAIMYQIFVDRFCRSDRKSDVLDDEYIYLGLPVRHIDDWNEYPSTFDVGYFYGGDLQGVRKKLRYLRYLGVEVIYFNPLFVSPSNHKYDTQDYDHIDPHLAKIVKDEGEVLAPGMTDNSRATKYISRTADPENLEASDAFFADLVREAHDMGIRIILDGVFNHCGSFNKWLDREKIYSSSQEYEKGAYLSSESPYADFFLFQEKDPSAWPDNDSYQGWWEHKTLPKLNYEGSEHLTGYILKIARKWVSPPYCADGWRLDVAADLGQSPEFNHRFWKAFRHEVKKANPDALIIAEHYGDAGLWLQGDEWDTIMNYDAFMEPVTWFFTGMEKHSDEYLEGQYGNADSFFGSMRYHMCEFMEPSLLCSMNQLSNHDHSRFLTRTNHLVGRAADYSYDAASEGVDPAVMREAVLLQMTWPGAPTLYYGDEAGLTGFTDPDNRRTYPWGREDRQMFAFYKSAIAMHKNHPVLKTGSIKFLGGGYQYIAYARFDDREQIACLFNNGSEQIQVTVPVWTAGVKAPGSRATATFFTLRTILLWARRSLSRTEH